MGVEEEVVVVVAAAAAVAVVVVVVVLRVSEHDGHCVCVCSLAQIKKQQAATKAAAARLEQGMGAVGELQREKLELQQRLDEATIAMDDLTAQARFCLGSSGCFWVRVRARACVRVSVCACACVCVRVCVCVCLFVVVCDCVSAALDFVHSSGQQARELAGPSPSSVSAVAFVPSFVRSLIR